TASEASALRPGPVLAARLPRPGLLRRLPPRFSGAAIRSSCDCLDASCTFLPIGFVRVPVTRRRLSPLWRVVKIARAKRHERFARIKCNTDGVAPVCYNSDLRLQHAALHDDAAVARGEVLFGVQRD